MSRKDRISDRIYEMLYNKLDSYKETIDENKELFNTLTELVNDKSHTINRELISKVDDVLEDIVTTNVTLKIIIGAMKQDITLSMSQRETDRNIRYEYIKTLLPLMLLLHNN
jgi:Zn-dependent oligopeptidase